MKAKQRRPGGLAATCILLDSLSLATLRMLALKRAELEGGRVSASAVLRGLIADAAAREKVRLKAQRLAVAK